MSDIRMSLRDRLVAKRGELSASLKRPRLDALSSQGRVAEDDQGPLEHEEFLSVRRNTSSYETLRLVDEALDRMDSGDYGVCHACEDAIPSRRLEALPWAKYCVPCQERTALMGEGQCDSARFEPVTDTYAPY